jgi:integrase
MAGQLIERGERTWLVRVFLGRDSQTGKRRYHNHTVNGIKKDAQKYLNAVLRELDLGTFVEPSRMSVDDYLDKWLDASKHNVRVRTHVWYTDLLKWFIRPAIGSKMLSEVRALDIQAICSEMQERDLSPRTIRHTLTTLSTALKQAVKWGLLVQNPVTLVEPPRMHRKEMQALSPEDAKQFLSAASGDCYGIVFIFALATGTRPEEYLGLQWKDVDLGRGMATVQRTLVELRGGGWHFGEPKTSRSRRTIPIPASIVRSLVEHKRKQGERRLKVGPAYQPHDLVFAMSDGGPMKLRNLVRRHFKPILKRAGLPDSIRLYDLRHSCATLLPGSRGEPEDR